MADTAAGAFTSARIGSLELKNRIIKAATYEGMSPGGVPSDRLLAFHRAIAEGGVAMTTIAYCAVEADGRIHQEMMYLHEGVADRLAALVEAVHAAGAKISGQLVHCGNFSRNRRLQRLKRPLGPSAQVNMMGIPSGVPLSGAMTLGDIDRLVDTFAEAARFMKRVGFDAAEIHFGHGYALSQFISPKTNRRNDAYGGSLENRMRLPLRVIEAVRDAVGADFPLLGKMSMSDGVKGGVSWDEGLEVAKLLDRGGIDALITSAGTSSFNPMLMFHGPSIATGMIETEKNPITRLALRWIGPALFRDYPYRELYLLDRARRIRDAVQCRMVYIGGCSTLQSIETVLGAGFDFVQLGRPLIKDPAFVRHAMADPAYENGCTHCNRCVGLIDHPDGIRCPLNDDIGQSTPDPLPS